MSITVKGCDPLKKKSSWKYCSMVIAQTIELRTATKITSRCFVFLIRSSKKNSKGPRKNQKKKDSNTASPERIIVKLNRGLSVFFVWKIILMKCNAIAKKNWINKPVGVTLPGGK